MIVLFFLLFCLLVVAGVMRLLYFLWQVKDIVLWGHRWDQFPERNLQQEEPIVKWSQRRIATKTEAREAEKQVELREENSNYQGN